MERVLVLGRSAWVAVAESVIQRLVKVPSQRVSMTLWWIPPSILVAVISRRSTLLKLLNAGKDDDAAQQLLMWDHSGGVVVGGLMTRREAELALWNGSSSAAQQGKAA
jgi:hypothetical protein